MPKYMIRLVSSLIKSRPVPDAILIQKAQQKDATSFGVIYERYLDAIYRYIYFRVDERKEEAEDLCEIVFYKAWQNLGTYTETTGSFSSWLYRIAHNSVIDYYRKKKTHAQLDETLPVDTTEELEEQLIREDESAVIHKALHTLSDPEKEVVILKYIEGYTYTQISQITGRREDALRAVVSRALKKLKYWMEEQ